MLWYLTDHATVSVPYHVYSNYECMSLYVTWYPISCIVTHETSIILVHFRRSNKYTDLYSNLWVLTRFLCRGRFYELTVLIQETNKLKRKSAISRWFKRFRELWTFYLNIYLNLKKTGHWWYCVKYDNTTISEIF